MDHQSPVRCHTRVECVLHRIGSVLFWNGCLCKRYYIAFRQRRIFVNRSALKKSALNSLGLGELLTVWFISLIVHLGVMIMMVAIVIVLASRIIEVFMYLGVAPIPMAAMLDSGEWSSIGKNWIKQLLALSFQGFFIIIALGIFKTLFSNAIVSLNSSTDGIILQMAMLLGYTVALIFTVLRTGAVSKSVFNAH